MWSLQTSLLYPAELLHKIMASPDDWPHLKKMTLIGSAIADHHDNRAVHVSYRYDEFGNRCDDGGNSGYWNTVSVNVWVPGYWVEERSHHGRCHRYFVAGHYEYRNSRVWVAHNRHDRYDRWDDRHDRDIGRGYGNNRYDRRDRDNDRDYDHDRRDRRR